LAVRFHPARKKLGLIAQYVIDQGGEGLILQKRGSMYQRGRSQSVLKLKVIALDFSYFYLE
jgi:hypothetical protein